jgi:hypothetical protein
MTIRRIKIENTDGIGYSTRVIDAETGEMIPGIQKIEMIFDLFQPVKAILHCIQVETQLDDVLVDKIVTTHVTPKKESYVTREIIEH